MTLTFASRQLLRFATPAIVQVDALISLLASYEAGRFRMFWTTAEVARQNVAHMSTVFDGCIWRCFLRDVVAAVAPISLLVVGSVYLYLRRKKY